jgi:hypothetical protein
MLKLFDQTASFKKRQLKCIYSLAELLSQKYQHKLQVLTLNTSTNVFVASASRVCAC